MRNNLKLIIASIAMISIALVSCQQKEESPIMKDVFNSNQRLAFTNPLILTPL